MKLLLWVLILLIPAMAVGGIVAVILALIHRRNDALERAKKSTWLAFGAFGVALGLCAVVLVASTYEYMFLDEPLVDAARSGDLARVRQLVARGADVNAEGDDGRGTALVAAASEGKGAVVQYLVQHGADVNRATSFGGRERTPLQAAAGHHAVQAILRNAGAQR